MHTVIRTKRQYNGICWSVCRDASRSACIARVRAMRAHIAVAATVSLCTAHTYRNTANHERICRLPLQQQHCNLGPIAFPKLAQRVVSARNLIPKQVDCGCHKRTLFIINLENGDACKHPGGCMVQPQICVSEGVAATIIARQNLLRAKLRSTTVVMGKITAAARTELPLATVVGQSILPFHILLTAQPFLIDVGLNAPF